jgi:hypothetical protein
MDATMQYIEKPLIALAENKGSSRGRASMVNLAALLQRCGTEEADPKELISFVDDVDEESGEVATVKVVL